jgi:HEAT repeat protein
MKYPNSSPGIDREKQVQTRLDQSFLAQKKVDVQVVANNNTAYKIIPLDSDLDNSEQELDLISSEDLEDDEDEIEEVELAEAEVDLEPEPIDTEEMLILLKSDVILERMKAARIFCEIEEPRAIPDLIHLLNDDCALVRVSAAYALGRNPSFEAVEHLIGQLQIDWNGYVRKGVVWALGTCRSQSALAPLISALRFDIAAVRLWAASALGQLGNIQAIAPVSLALQNDKVDAVRSNCAWALGKLLSAIPSSDLLEALEEDEEIYEEAIDGLIGALEDDDLGVRDDARLTLRKLNHPRGLKVLDKIELDQGFCDLF